MKRSLQLLTIGIVLTLSLSSFAQDRHNIERIGYYGANWGEIWNIEIQGDLAYLASFDSGLRIIDISNPEQPDEVNFFDAGGNSRAVVVEGNYAYVANSSRGLEVIDISDPRNPAEVSVVETDWWCRNVALRNRHAFLIESYGAEDCSRLRIIDIEDPTEPDVISSCNFDGWCYYIELTGTGDYAFIGSSTDEHEYYTHLIDISDIHHPELAEGNNRHLYADARDISIDEDLAFITSGYSLQVLDISNPLHPERIGRLGFFNHSPFLVEANEDYAYLTGGRIVRIIDISDPENPREVGTCEIGGEDYIESLSIAGDYLYLSQGGLKIIDVSRPNRVEEVSYLNPQFQNFSEVIGTGDDYLYANWNILDVSDPSQPELIGDFEHEDLWEYYRIISGERLYYTSSLLGSPIFIVDISDPQEPEQIGVYDDSRYHPPFDVSDDLLYYAKNDTLKIVDLSQPDNPELVGFFTNDEVDEHWEYVKDIKSNNDLLLICQNVEVNWLDKWFGIRILDISDPAELEEVTIFRPEENYSYSNLVFGDDFFCYTDGNREEQFRLVVIDLSDPFEPEIASIYEGIENPQSVHISGDFAFVADGRSGIKVIDLSDIYEPELVGYYDTPGSAADVFISDNIAYVADIGMLGVYDCSLAMGMGVGDSEAIQPVRFNLLSAYPNPFNSQTTVTFTLQQAGNVNLTMYDVLGRQIKQLTPAGWLQSGQHHVNIDANRLSSGNYLLKMESDNNMQVQPVTLVK